MMTSKQNRTAVNNKPLRRSGLVASGIFASLLLLAGCEKQAETPASESAETTTTSSEDASDLQPESDVLANSDDSSDFASTQNTPIKIDWQAIASGVKPVDPDTFDYPFALDSASVKSQASFSNISPKQAQHTLTIGMAGNEPLEAILNQLGDSYLSHTFSEKEAKLIVYTTPNVEPSTSDYVIAHEFARGLTLPIDIMHRPQSDKTADDQTEQAATELEAAH